MNFLEKFNNKKNIRFEMFKKVFDISLQRKLKTIVETGTTRGKIKFFFFKKYNWKDGMSTIMFANFAEYINGHLHTCDISEKNIKSAKSDANINSLRDSPSPQICIESSLLSMALIVFTIIAGTRCELLGENSS